MGRRKNPELFRRANDYSVLTARCPRCLQTIPLDDKSVQACPNQPALGIGMDAVIVVINCLNCSYEKHVAVKAMAYNG